CAAGSGTAAALSSTSADAVMAGAAAGGAVEIIAGGEVSNSGRAGLLDGEAIVSASRLADWSELPADTGVSVFAGVAALAASAFFRRSPRATRSVPFACS